ncbi:MAG: glycosyltransferase family 2 protein [Deltaproteobacteria bacterium]|nr:glycosyltransferase family 2 protein [Deltaproteobacteria bacterium]
MQKISVTIIALNEEENISACLESVKWADEILVSDSGSADKTVQICKEYGAKVFIDEWHGFGRQKNLIASRAKNNWILNIDADERITPDLKKEIESVLNRGCCEGYNIPRKNFFGNKWIRHCGWYPDYNLRLYRKDKARFNERNVHEAVQINGKVGCLKNPLEHYTYKNISDYLKRMDRYSTLAAEEMFKTGFKGSRVQGFKGARVRMVDLTLRPFFTFLKMFILQKGFMEGYTGLVLSGLYASYTFSKYAKLWEMSGKDIDRI